MSKKNKNSIIILTCVFTVILISGLSCSNPLDTNETDIIGHADEPLLKAVEYEVPPTSYKFGDYMYGFKDMVDHTWNTLDSFHYTDIVNDQDKIVIADIQTTNGNDPCALRFDNDYDNGSIREYLTVKVQEETSHDSEMEHTYPEILGGLLVDAGTIYDQYGNIIGEAKSIENVSQESGEIYSFAGAAGFDDPVVFANVRTYDGSHPCHVRITDRVRSGQGWSFYYFIEEWDYQDGDHNPERIDFLILEKGIHKIGSSSGGTYPYFLEVGTYTPYHIDLMWRLVPLYTDFSMSPIVITQSQTDNGWHQIVTRNRYIEPEDDVFSVRMYEEEARWAAGDRRHNPEEIGYLAIGLGHQIYEIDDPEYINLITGYHNQCINEDSCEDYLVWGTDLGIPFYHPQTDRIYYVYGDSYSDIYKRDWRTPIMSWSEQMTNNMASVRSGYFDDWLNDGTMAKQLWTETTHIPTTAWSMNGRMYIWSMAVNFWGGPGEWNTASSWLMYSENNGVSWTKMPYKVADANERTAMAAAWTGDPNWIYFYVSYPGRLGHDPSGTHPVYLMRVPKNTFPTFDIETEGYFLNGYYPEVEWVSKGNWNHPTVIFSGNIGELSVTRFSSIDNYFIAMYQDYTDSVPGNSRFTIAQSKNPYGPWSVSGTFDLAAVPNPYGSGFVNSYGGFMCNEISNQNTPGSVDVYFTISEWGVDFGDRYNIHLLKIRLHE